MTGRGKNLGKEKKCQTEVNGRAEYCPRCVAKRRNASRRIANIGLEPRSIADSPLGAEALTKAKMTSGYGNSGTPHQVDKNLDLKEPVS